MIPKHNPIHCIVPPHILRAMAAHKDKRVREIAFRTLTMSAHMRGRRRGARQDSARGSRRPEATVDLRCPAQHDAAREAHAWRGRSRLERLGRERGLRRPWRNL